MKTKTWRLEFNSELACLGLLGASNREHRSHHPRDLRVSNSARARKVLRCRDLAWQCVRPGRRGNSQGNNVHTPCVQRRRMTKNSQWSKRLTPIIHILRISLRPMLPRRQGIRRIRMPGCLTCHHRDIPRPQLRFPRPMWITMQSLRLWLLWRKCHMRRPIKRLATRRIDAVVAFDGVSIHSCGSSASSWLFLW